MTIDRTINGDHITLALEGRLDTTTAPQLQEMLLAEINGGKTVELNFAKLAYVSSAGLRVLLMGEKAAKATGHKQTISHVSTEIMEVFEMTGFDSILCVEN